MMDESAGMAIQRDSHAGRGIEALVRHMERDGHLEEGISCTRSARFTTRT